MSRLLVHVEGETEESFVNEILAPHLYAHGYAQVSARIIGNARQRGRRGGIKPWNSVRQGILNHLHADRECIVTTMVDYYGMPQNEPRAWPGRKAASDLETDASLRARKIEEALAADIRQEMGSGFSQNRFIPYVAMHEFEALLFSDCNGFSTGIGISGLAPEFQSIRDAFTNPEEIDDSPTTAPSKRIEKLVPGYQKPLLGTLAALNIGLPAMRSACPHFATWLKRLEAETDER